MRAVIVGGGKVGYYLLKTLQERKYKVTLIEKTKELCDKIAEEVDADIIHGNGSDLEVLEEADIENADVVAAVTGKDEENLIICQMAKINFNIKNTIARINNPKNRSVFKTLGVDKTVCSTEVIAGLIEGEFKSDEVTVIQTFKRGEMILAEAKISEKSPWCNKKVSEIKMPKECVILSIMRNDEVLFPRGDSEVLNEDMLIIVTNMDKKYEVEKCIIGG